jgi:DNA-binding NtrC family response regulator
MQNATTDQMKERILVIQSDPAEKSELSVALGDRYVLYFAEGIDQALQISRTVPHKVVIFDASDANPHELSELHRFKSGYLPERPIILLSSKNSIEIEMAVAAIGVFYYLIRPYSVMDLEELIEAGLRYWQRIFGWTRADGNAGGGHQELPHG